MLIQIKNLPVLILVPLFLLCPGCWDYREIEQSSVPSAVGVDLKEDNKLNFSTLLVQPLPPGEAGSSTLAPVLVAAEGRGAALAARRTMLSLSKVPEWAHARTIILGENLVKSDLTLAVDFMTRNRSLRPDISLFISSAASPEDILSARFPQINDLGTGLLSMVTLNQNQLGIYVPITLEEFTYYLATPGIEPLVPQISLVDVPTAGKATAGGGDIKADQTNNKNKQLSLNGAAAFKGPRMVGSLNETECRGYRWLRPSTRMGGLFIIPSPRDPAESIALEVVEFDSQSRPEIVDGEITMRIKINAVLDFNEQSGASPILDPETVGQIEPLAAREIERQILSCVSRSQELRSDFLGWGRLVYEYKPVEWKALESNWPDLFPNVKADLRVKAVLKSSGMISKSFQFE